MPSSSTVVSAPMPPSEAARRWLLLAVATLQQAGLTFVRFGLPTVAPFIRADLGLSLTQTGVVLGAFDLGALVAFYATGVATDRFGERRVMALGAWFTGLLAAASAAAPGMRELAIVLALAGAGFPSSQVAGSHAVMGWFHARERGVAMGVRQAGLPLGGLAGALVLPWVAASAGWRLAMVVAGAGCILAGLATFLALPDGEPAAHSGAVARPGLPLHREPSPVRALPAGGFLQAPRQFLRDRALVATTLMACLLAASQFSLTGYLPLYMVDVFRWDRQAASRLLLVVHAGGIAGRLLWGWVSDRRFHGDRVAPLVTVSLSGALGAALIAALALAPLPPAAVAGSALLAGLTLLGWNGLYITLISELSGPASAVMLGISMTVLYVWTMLSPPGFGWLVERLGSYPAAWTALVAIQLMAAVAATAAGSFAPARRAGAPHRLRPRVGGGR
ncbi:MFS transporter [Carboxydochorda subterranea]|uniref:MFS transporter n=1 Tax=Carboxydichorda subterranea TaxID=3109565 RepID=A0ABZ1C108_9FIRM|nr:MFS transporter [Limnochorda sp. L945t]WRP18762.1 MFS transporter [Limnochorda sp. L945t]